MAKVLTQKNSGRQKVRIDGVGQYDWEEAGPGGGGGGGQTIGGCLTFATDGSGDPQTITGRVLPSREIGSSTPPHRGGLILPAGTLRNLRVKAINADGGDLTNVAWTVTVYTNDGASALVVNGNASGSQKDAVHTVAVVEFDDVQIVVSYTATDGPSNPQDQIQFFCSVDFAPAA
jgi:hypothetical protein